MKDITLVSFGGGLADRVFQSPLFRAVGPGDPVQLDCSYTSSEISAFHWYKVSPNGGLEWVMSSTGDGKDVVGRLEIVLKITEKRGCFAFRRSKTSDSAVYVYVIQALTVTTRRHTAVQKPGLAGGTDCFTRSAMPLLRKQVRPI